MGRQTAIAATQADEDSFLDFVRTTAAIRIAVPFAPSIEEIWVDGVSREPDAPFAYSISIWNTAFDWTPIYGRVATDSRDFAGWYYVKNRMAAPIVEFSRTNWERGEPGRLYWARNFAAPDGLAYDASAFSKWYDRLVGWIRKHGKKIGTDRHDPYYLPDASGRQPLRN